MPCQRGSDEPREEEGESEEEAIRQTTTPNGTRASRSAISHHPERSPPRRRAVRARRKAGRNARKAHGGVPSSSRRMSPSDRTFRAGMRSFRPPIHAIF